MIRAATLPDTSIHEKGVKYAARKDIECASLQSEYFSRG